jgi:hypothetical protein
MCEYKWQAATYKVSSCAAASISLQVLRFKSASAAAEMPSFLLGDAARKSAVINQLSAIVIQQVAANRIREKAVDALGYSRFAQQRNSDHTQRSKQQLQYGCRCFHKADQGQGQKEREGAAQGEQEEAERRQEGQAACSTTTGTRPHAYFALFCSLDDCRICSQSIVARKIAN